MDAQKKKLIKKRILPTALVAATIPFVLFFVVPFEIYSTNRDEFLFSAGDFLPLMALFGLLIAAGMFFAMLFLRPFAYKMFRNVYLMFGFLLFMQGIFLNRGMSSFSTNGAGAKVSLLVFNTWLWIFLLGFAVGFTFYDDKKEISTAVCMILSAVILITQSVSFIASAATTKGVFASKTKLDDPDGVPLKILTTEDLTTVSSNRNVLFFCIDKFDEEYADYGARKMPEVYENLDGFTRFTDHITLYGHTYPSVPYMITNREYQPEKLRGEFLGSVYQEDDSMVYLHNAGYKTNVYSQQYYVYTTQSQFADYVTNSVTIKKVKVRNPFNIGVHLVHMALYRCFPLVLKNTLGVLNANQCNRNVTYTGSNDHREYSAVNNRALKSITSTPFVTTEQNVFKFVHIEGCHEAGKSVNTKKALKQSFAVVNQYLDYLKEAGTYKDATIVITGDHPFPYYNDGKLGGPKLTALFVKPSGSAETRLVTSSAPVSHKDIWPTIMQSEGIEVPETYGTSVFDIDENSGRERTFYWHTYQYDNNMNVYRYSVVGNGADFNNWQLQEQTHFDHGIMA